VAQWFLIIQMHIKSANMDNSNFFQEQINLFIGALVAGIISAITLFFKKLPHIVSQKSRRSIIMYDWSKANMINAIIQDTVDDVGCIYGHVIQYHNHGPIKMTVLYEATGHPCQSCLHQCGNAFKIERLQKEWINRPILPFWLNHMALKTLEKNGLVNLLLYDKLDDLHKEIWNNANIYSYREILVSTKSDGFITLGLSFCERFKEIQNVDAKMISAANQLHKLS
jgi:hypothetical protein